MNDKLANYLTKEKANYEKGLVLKSDVLMWIALYAENQTELVEAERQVEAWK